MQPITNEWERKQAKEAAKRDDGFSMTGSTGADTSNTERHSKAKKRSK